MTLLVSTDDLGSLEFKIEDDFGSEKMPQRDRLCSSALLEAFTARIDIRATTLVEDYVAGWHGLSTAATRTLRH